MKYLLIIATLTLAGCCKEDSRVQMYIPADKQTEAMNKEIELIKYLSDAGGSSYTPTRYAETAHEEVMSIYGVPITQRKSD